MSIWCSHETIGWDDFDHKKPKMRRGHVRSYAAGWSNHYPTTDGTVERPATIELAHIAPWCVPGHEYSDGWNPADDRCVGPWLRLGVDSWAHDYKNPRDVVGRQSASVVLNVKAVRSLVEQLTDWLNTPKLKPPKPEPPEGA